MLFGNNRQLFYPSQSDCARAWISAETQRADVRGLLTPAGGFITVASGEDGEQWQQQQHREEKRTGSPWSMREGETRCKRGVREDCARRDRTISRHRKFMRCGADVALAVLGEVVLLLAHRSSVARRLRELVGLLRGVVAPGDVDRVGVHRAGLDLCGGFEL